MTLSSPAPDELPLLREIYMESFPPVERRPWEKIVSPAGPESPRLQVVHDGADGIPLGLVTTWEFPRFTYIEHLAVDRRMRGRGTGTYVLKALAASGKPLVLEVEPESGADPMTSRRIDFYRRNGFVLLDHPYVQPPYAPGLPPVALRLMTTAPEGVPAEEISALLHLRVYGFVDK